MTDIDLANALWERAGKTGFVLDLESSIHELELLSKYIFKITGCGVRAQ